MQLSQLGEFGLIEQIHKLFPLKRKDTLIGIGDDCAVLEIQDSRFKIQNKSQILNPESKKNILITTDALVEGVHFDFRHTSYSDLGQKALAVNISDIAAMGGVPTHAVVTIGVPGQTKVESLKQFAKGIRKLAQKYQIDLVGGDTVSSPKAIFVSIYLLGIVSEKNLLTRANARVGDAILATGSFGLPASRGYRINRHPIRLPEGQKLSGSGLVKSMIDASDGLARSAHELCKASRVGAKIFADKVPIAKGATLDQALYGGEDYELVFTAGARHVKEIQKLVRCSIVGEIVQKRSGIKLVETNGKISKLKAGYEHFKKASRT